jgi:hypothetical protein
MIYSDELESTATPAARPYVVIAIRRQDAVVVDDPLAGELCLNGT